MSPDFSVMGVLNATPDSFSDGGLYLDANAAIAHARELIAQGADIIDVGGESTRPGAEPVAAADELRRVLPVVEGIAAIGGTSGGSGVDPGSGFGFGSGSGSGSGVDPGSGSGSGVDPGSRPGSGVGVGALDVAGSAAAQISIDTAKSSVARAALDAGATIVNDVTALRGDPLMAEVVAESGCECCLMHMLGSPRTMQTDPHYRDVVDDVRAFLSERVEYAMRAGIREERIVLDPGIGFGKTVAHNLELLRRLDELVALGRPVLVGTSRKSFIGRLIAEALEAGDDPVEPMRRLPGTIATNVLAYERGASIFRVHDVAPVRAALAVTAATLGRR